MVPTRRSLIATTRLRVLLIALIFLSPARAEAQYLDPGNTSLLWQLLVAGGVGLVFSLRHYVITLYRRLFSRRDKGPRQHTDEA